MNLRNRIAAALLAASSLATVHASAANYTNYTGFSIDPTPVLPAEEVHPSLWFGKDGIAALRARREGDEHAGILWKHIAASPYLADDPGDPPTLDMEKEIVHKYYGDMSQRAMANAFMSLMAEDAAEAARFRARAIAALERAWDGPVYSIDPKNSSTAADEIYHAVWAQSFAAAYDWVQPSLAPDVDARIRERLRAEAQYIHDNLRYWTDRPHNHLSKPAWGLGTLALVLSDEPDAKQWLALALAASNENTRYCFSADGIYREGSQYDIFSLINYVPFLYHYRNVSGVDGFSAFQPAFEWPVLTRNASGWMPNIEDSYIRPFPSQLVAGAYMDANTRLHSTAPLGEILTWNFSTTDYGPFDSSRKTGGFDYTGASWDYPMELVEYLCYVPGLRATAPDCSPTVFMDGGETVFRNNWGPAGPGQRYLLFQGVAEMDNHEHMEHLSFIVQAEGQMMASDSGYSRKSYGEKIRTEWYRTAEAHNVVTANGEAPCDPAENWTPPSHHRIDTAFFDFEEKRAPYAAGGVHARAIAFPGEEYFVVLDRVMLPEAREISLNLHGGRGTLEHEGESWTWTFSKDAYGPPARLAAWIMAPGATFAEKNGEITYLKGDYAEFPYVDATVTAAESPFMQILWPAAIDGPLPTVEDIGDAHRLAARVTAENWTDVVAVQLRPLAIALEDITTDACHVWSREQEGRSSWSAAQVTRFEAGGRSISFSAPVAFAAREEADGVHLSVSAAAPVTMRWRGAVRAASAGTALPLRIAGNVAEVDLPASGDHVIFEEAAP